LILKSNQPSQPATAYCAGDCGPYKDSFYYEAELVDERASEFGYGILFSINDAKNGYYAYKIRPSTGDYGLFKLVDGNWTQLIDWTKTTAILPPPKTNILGVSLAEKNILLYLNGSWLASSVDDKPYNEGRIGFIVDQDGVRLIASTVQVYQLRPTTPVPPGQVLTPIAPPGQPTFTPGFPTPVGKFTPTPTAVGSCPKDTPKDTWILVVTNVSTGKNEIIINGVKNPIDGNFASFYLSLNVDYTIQAGNKTYDYNFPVCKIIYIKVK
jgi:hypothetical protein